MIIHTFITAPIVLFACQAQASGPAAPGSASAATPTAAQRVPESVLPVFQELLGLLKTSSAGGPIHLRRLDTEVERGTNGGKTLVVTTLELAIPVADSVQATQRYDSLCQAIRQSPWCVELRTTGTKMTSDGCGLLVPDLTVLADPARVSPTGLTRAHASSGQSPEVLARTLAASPVLQLGQIKSSVRTVTPELGVTEAVYRFRSAGPSAYGLERLKIFFQELDASLENSALSAIHLVPARRTADLDAIDSWPLDAALTVRD
jgi:hypothetical protein